MCYPKPGPRCSAHAKKAYSQARIAFANNNTEENKQALYKASREFMTTPAGIKSLERLAEREEDPENSAQFQKQASKARKMRQEAIDAYKSKTGEEVEEEDSTIVRPSKFMRNTFLANAYKESASENAKESYASFQRSDTDGALSQIANDKMSGLNSAKANLAEKGGLHEFPAVYDTEGNLVKAVQVQGQYGTSWGIVDPDNPDGKFKGFFNPSKAKDPDKAKENDAKKGYYVGTAIAPARADLYAPPGAKGTGGTLSVNTVILPKDKSMKEAVPVDNGHVEEKDMEKIRKNTYPDPLEVEANKAKEKAEVTQRQKDLSDQARKESDAVHQKLKDNKSPETIAYEKKKADLAEKKRQRKTQFLKAQEESMSDTENCQECKNGSPVPHYPNYRCRVGGKTAHCSCAACL